jgi:hypothetical protein
MRLVSTDPILVDSLIARALHGALVPTATAKEAAAELVATSLGNRGALARALAHLEQIMVTSPSRTAARAIADLRAAVHHLDIPPTESRPALRLVS